MENTNIRKSSIELLKIIGMFLIIIDHTLWPLSKHPEILFSYMSDRIIFTNPSNDIMMIVLQFIKYFGQFGNIIFFTCSSWFLIDKKTFRKNRVFELMLTNWFVSVLWFIVLYFCKEEIEPLLAFKSFFPNLYGTYWYVSTYILFYLLCPYLNIIINGLNQKSHLKINIVLFIMYSVINNILPAAFKRAELIMFIVVYFYTTYIKKYMPNFTKNIKLNVLLLISSLICIFVYLVLLNYIGMKTYILDDKMLRLNTMTNTFVFIFGISAFNIFNNMDFHNKFINRLGSLSLLIYLIHNNYLFSNITRFRIGFIILRRFGRNTVILQIFIRAIIVLVLVAVIALIFDFIFGKPIKKVADYLTNSFDIFITKISDYLIKIS